MKKVLTLIPLLVAFAVPAQAFAAPAQNGGDVCPTMDGKAHPGGGWEGQAAPGISVSGNDELVTVTVAAGTTLQSMCVKTGGVPAKINATFPVVGPASFTVEKTGPGGGISHLTFDVTTTPQQQPTDVCPNMEGNQSSVPADRELVNGQCVKKDVCPNMDGRQESVPDDHELVNGQCVKKEKSSETDVCPNMEGRQESVPSDRELVNGQCLKKDACPNMEGRQESVPSDREVVNGQCVLKTTTNTTPTNNPTNNNPTQTPTVAGGSNPSASGGSNPSAGSNPTPSAAPPAPAATQTPTGGVAGAEKTITPKQAAAKIRRVGRAAALPFTGLPLAPMALLGLLLLGSGVALRRVQ